MRILLSILISLILLPVPCSAQVRVQRSKQEITSAGKRYYMHTVTRGQTLSALAKAYQVSEEAIIEKNPFVKKGIKARQSLLIPTESTYKEWVAQHKKDKVQKQDDQVKTITPAQDTIVVADEKHKTVTTGQTRARTSNEVIRVVMMLPLKEDGSRTNENFADFYKGSLIALDKLKSEGVTTHMSLISTNQNIERLINNGSLDKADLIIGPIYKDALAPVIEYATMNRVPIVSPLASVGEITSPYLFQATPTEHTKYDKLHSTLTNRENNIVLIKHSTDNDSELFNDLSKLTHAGVPTINYSKGMEATELTALLSKDKENVVIAPIDNESAVEELLSRLSSLNTMAMYKITVIGSSRWARFNNINFEMFFKLNTQYVTNYHNDRTNPAVVDFYRNYVQAFGTVPSMFSMRGYDVTLMFVSAINEYNSLMPFKISNFNKELLQVKYKFKQGSETSSFLNQEWVLVNYTPQFNIEVK